MIKFESFSQEDTDTVKFIITIENYSEIVMDFKDWEIEMIRKANESGYSPVQTAKVFLMIAEKMENRKIGTSTFLIADDKVIGEIQGDGNGKKKSS